MATPVIQSGDYLVEFATGFLVDAFRLDSSQLDGLDVLDGSTEFADITPFVQRITYRRGRRDDTDQFGPGTMSVLIDDTLAGGILSPFDITSPYVNPITGRPGLAPLRAIRVSRQGDLLFVGNVTNYDYQFTLGGTNLVNVFAADGFYKLAQATLDEWNVTPQRSDQRLADLLDKPEVALFPGALRDIQTGVANLGHNSAFTVPQGTNALQYAQQINDTAEFGRLFMSRTGVFTFRQRVGQTLSGPVANFTDDGSAVPYYDLEIAFDATHVVNRASLTNLDEDTGTANDVASQTEYFIQSRAINASLLDSQSDLDTAADYLLVGEPAARYTSVSCQFASLTGPQRDAIALIDIGDTITIEKNITGFGNFTEELAVEGMEAVIDFAQGHRVTFYTSPTTIVTLLVLDDPQYGQLDALNVLG